MGIQNDLYGGGRAQLELHVQTEMECGQLWSALLRLCLERLWDSADGILVDLCFLSGGIIRN